LSALALAVVALINRPLLLSSMSAELTRARGINVRGVGVLFMIAMAVSVGLSSIAVGSILSTALLIGPAAASVRVTKSLRASLIVAGVLGVATTWLGILFAYDSFYWVPSSQGLPVSFFIVSLIFVAYLTSGLPFVRRRVDRPRAISMGASTASTDREVVS
jgi:zinc/manganese transport system permease protein